MKKIIGVLLAFVCLSALGQTFPVQNLTVAGTSVFTGAATHNGVVNANAQLFVADPANNSVTLGITNTGSNGANILLTGNGVTTPNKTIRVTGGALQICNSAYSACPVFVTDSGNISSTGGIDNTVIGSATPLAGTFTTLTATTYKNLPGCVAIETFGGKGDNSTDNLAAWNSAVASFGTGPICIAFGVGQYKFSAAASATPGSSASIAVVGAGRSVTQLIWGATNGFVFATANQQAAQVHDMSLLTSAVNASSAAITINSGECNGSKQSSNFDNLTIEGTGSYPFTNYWGVGITTNELSFINVNNLDVFGSSGSLGDGIHFNGSATGPCYAFNIMISKSNFINTHIGVVPGTYAQGIFINQSNFTNGFQALQVPPGVVNVDQINISDTSINTTDDQILVASTSPIIGLYVNHNTIAVPSGKAGVHISSASSLIVISDNTIFNPPGASVGDGVVVDGAATDGMIIGNAYKYLAFGNVLGASSSKWNVQSNVYDATVTTPNSNASGSNTVGGGSP